MCFLEFFFEILSGLCDFLASLLDNSDNQNGRADEKPISVVVNGRPAYPDPTEPGSLFHPSR